MDAIRLKDLELAVRSVAAAGLATGSWSLLRGRVTAPAATAGIAAAVVLADERFRFRYGRGVPNSEIMLVAVGLLAVTVWIGLSVTLTDGDRIRPWLLPAALVTAAGTWIAVPETRGIVVVGASVGAAWLISLLPFVGRHGRSPTAGAVAVMVGAVAFAGAFYSAWTPTRQAGAIACAGLFACWPAGRLLRSVVERVVPLPGIAIGPWLLVVHLGLTLAAARWLGVAPDGTWIRLVILGVVGAAVSAACRTDARLTR